MLADPVPSAAPDSGDGGGGGEGAAAAGAGRGPGGPPGPAGGPPWTRAAAAAVPLPGAPFCAS